MTEFANRCVCLWLLRQGQDVFATRMIHDGLEQGNWVFLQNCHLSISWMPALDNIIEEFCSGKGKEPHPRFRLWLSSDPHPKFPIAILQRGEDLRASLLPAACCVLEHSSRICY